MNKKIKTILFILIMLFNVFFIFQNSVSAADDDEKYSGEGGNGIGEAGKTDKPGGWSVVFGYYISVYDQNHKQKGYKYFGVGDYDSSTPPKISGWFYKENKIWYTDPTKLYEYLDIPYSDTTDHYKNDDYKNLLSKVNKIKKIDSEDYITIGSGDYITIEPYTLIGGIPYTFRTILAPNLNFNGSPYHSYYWTPAVLLANAAKVGEDIKVGGKTFTAPNELCDEPKLHAEDKNFDIYTYSFCGYSSNNNIGYGITVVSYEAMKDYIPTGTVKIYIKRKDGTPIISNNATFEINDLNNTQVTTSSGVVEHTLNQGTYNIKQIAPPGQYTLVDISSNEGSADLSNKSVNISITANNDTEVIFYYNTSCEVDFEELGTNPSVESLINLYKSYPNDTNLLNFESPSCGKANCNKNVTLGCLSGNNTSNVTFNENNLSCYDVPITDAYGNYIGFCLDYFNLTNNLGTSKFYGISGQFLIRQNNNVLTIYNENLDPVKINSQYIATAKNGKVCYILKGNTYNDSSNIKTSDVYFGNVDEATGDSQTDLLDNVTAENPVKEESKGKFTKYTYELTHNYKFLKEIYLIKLTGEYSNIKTTQTTQTPIYGIFSQFNSSSGTIPFALSYGGDTYTSNECKYETKKEIIKYDKTSSGNIELEFRTIDTNNPFVFRNTKSNWCDDTGDCKKNNSKVQAVIKERNNSYNQTGAGPKYKITLTPSDIEIIREYNTNPYDNYLTVEVNYRGNKIIRNQFLYSLESGKLNNKNLSNSLYNANYN